MASPNTFEIQKGAFEDLDTFSEILILSHAEDPTYSQCFPGAFFEAQREFWSNWFRDDFSHPGERLFKIVDSNNKKNIVSFVKARYPGVTSSQEGQPQPQDPIPPEGTNVKLLEHWFGQMDRFKHQYVDSDPKTYYVNLICTRPEYWKRGLARMLLGKVIEDAGQETGGKSKIFLEATPTGASVYPRLGWRVVEDMLVETPKGTVVWECMMRDSESLSEL